MSDQSEETETGATAIEKLSAPAGDPKNMQEVTQYVSINLLTTSAFTKYYHSHT